MKRYLAAIAPILLLAACGGSSASATPPRATLVPVVQITPAAATAAGVITIKSGQPSLVNYSAGQYAFAWTVKPGCSQLFHMEVAPTSGTTPIVLTDGAAKDGSVTVAIPDGRAYLNSSGCEYTVTITPA